MFVEAAAGAEFPDACADWLESSVDQIEQQTAVITACKTAAAEAHAQRWTPELEFTSAETLDASGNVHVTGTAESVNELGERWEWVYECTVSVEDGIRVLTAGTDLVR